MMVLQKIVSPIQNVPFSKIIIPTIDTIRYEYLIRLYMSKKQPILLAGPRGCGKTFIVKNAFENMDGNLYSFVNINMIAATTSNDVQETIEEKLEKRTKELYIPPNGKTMVVFLDDIHMPIKETCGAQPPLELMRQWVDYGFWYDRKKQCQKNVKNMLLVCSMAVFDRVKRSISDRVMSCFSVVNMTTPRDNDIYKIYETILSRHLTNFDETVFELVNGLTSMTISLYKYMIDNISPTPAKMHYLFNLRDVSKVFQGLLRANIKYQNFKVPILRLWCHEVFRVFNDRLIDENDQKQFLDQINHQLRNNYNLTYRDLCSSERNPIFCSFLNEQMLYQEIVDEKYMKQFIENSIKEYNSESLLVSVDMLLFRDHVEHICRIVRVISQPMGHILLIGIGGSGKSSLAKIASWLCKYSIFTIELSKSYGTLEFKEDLKLIYSETGIKNQPTSFVFSDAQIIDDSFLKIINGILSTGEVTNLFKETEFDQMKNALTEVAQHSHKLESTDAVNTFFIDRVKNNLHFILSFSPIEKQYRKRLQQYPSLINCTTVDWFLDWPNEALLEVASTSLSDLDILTTITGSPRKHGIEHGTATQDKLKSSLASVFASIHRSVIKFSKTDLNRTNNVTHSVYLKMISKYKEILQEKRTQKQSTSIKLRNGLNKINDTNNEINDMTMELEKVNELITKYTKECEEMVNVISKHVKEIDEQKKRIDIVCTKIKEDEMKCQEMYSLALAELKLTIPGLEEATNKICALSKKELSDIKSFSVPPEGVKLVLEAVMTLKKADPSWAEAKRQLGDPNFLIQLKEFDKDDITDDVFKQIELFLKNPEFELEKIGTQSIAAKCLAMWVIAVEKYAKMSRTTAPKRASADLAMATVQEEQISLGELEVDLTEKQNLLERQKLEYDERIIEKEHLIAKTEELKNNLEKATKLIDGLDKERKKWNKTVNQIDMEFDYLPGDCVLSTAFVSYMGPFKFKSRECLMNLWLTFMKDNGAPNNPNFEITLFLTNPETIRNWNNHGLSKDRFSLENGIIVSQSYRYPLIIDPQSQAWKWIENIEKDNGLKIIDCRSTKYMQTLEIALQNGYPTLMQIDFEYLDPHIISILSKSILKQSNDLFVRMGNKLLPYNENFRICITTKIKNIQYLPNLSSQMTIVDFTIQAENLEEQLLKTLVTMENPSLEELIDNTAIVIEKDKKSLVGIRDELLKLLDESECSLLENEQLLQTLRSSKAAFNIIKEQLQNSLASQADICKTREGYRLCAKRASTLYFIINDLDNINPMYQFSLDFYITLFENSIKKSNGSEKLDERITHLNEYHTYAVYENVCHGLFEQDKLPFSFQICIKTLNEENQINKEEFDFLLNDITKTKTKNLSTAKCPDWLPTTCWNNILSLSNVPNFCGVEESFEQFSTEWYTWYTAPEPENVELIGQWENKCNLLQRMLFLKCLRSDRLAFSIKHFISVNLGAQYSRSPVWNFKNIIDNLNNKNTLIFILSPGADPSNMLMNMATNKKAKLVSLSLGNGLESIATNLIQIGQNEGHWVFLANCHFLLSWMPLLDEIISTMQDGKVHPNFKLWLSSKPHPKFPISLLQKAIKISTEKSKSIKSSLLRLYQNINNEQFSQNQSSSKYKKILFNLCLFHCILVGRKKFQNLGWNMMYDFSDSDFEASEKIVYNYLGEYEDTPSWNALKYLIGNIFYGGNVIDIWDKRLLDTYVNQFFDENSLTTSFYKHWSLTNVHVPENGSFESYKDYIKTLPSEDEAHSFGQHPNANIFYLTRENQLLCKTLVCLQDQLNGSSVDDDNKDNEVLLQITQILRDMPPSIDQKPIVENIEKRKTYMSDFVLLQEVTRYNHLLKKMKIELVTLEKGIAGLMVIPANLNNMFQTIYEGKVPDQWLKTYTSLMGLGEWMQNLIERVKYFTTWASTCQQPTLIWLGAFTFPKGFLTSILQIESKNSSMPIDLLDWVFIPISTPLDDLKTTPNKGVYVHNLYLEGASWDVENSCLCEPAPLEFMCKLPVIHFIPTEGKKKFGGLYQCPVHYCSKRSGEHNIDSCIVVLNLRSGSQHPDHWIRRATAILLNL